MDVSITYWLLDAIIIFIACFCVDILFRVYDARKNKKREALMCDICHKPRKLKQTWDRSLWVCRACNKLYLEEFKRKEVPNA